MKKIFTPILAAVLMCMASCQSQFALTYKVHVIGDADGNVSVEFPQGFLVLNGDANLELVAGDTVPLNNVTTKKAVLANNKKKEVAALNEVNNALANEFNAAAASGTYDLLIQGVVTETVTGLSFVVNKHLTNRADSTAAPLRKSADNNYPYVL